jgi:hypothetical protein
MHSNPLTHENIRALNVGDLVCWKSDLRNFQSGKILARVFYNNGLDGYDVLNHHNGKRKWLRIDYRPCFLITPRKY